MVGEFVKGKTWTTDAVHRETRGNFEKCKAEGYISVEMECVVVQAIWLWKFKCIRFIYGDDYNVCQCNTRTVKHNSKYGRLSACMCGAGFGKNFFDWLHISMIWLCLLCMYYQVFRMHWRNGRTGASIFFVMNIRM